MELRFKVNPYYLAVHSIERIRDNKPFPSWVKLVKKLKSQSLFVFQDNWQVFTKINDYNQLENVLKKTEITFRTIFKTDEFERLLQETETYRAWVEKEWNKNKEQVLGMLANITGLEFPDSVITVIITHPHLSNGSNIPKEKTILWGHSEDWNNYTIVWNAMRNTVDTDGAEYVPQK